MARSLKRFVPTNIPGLYKDMRTNVVMNTNTKEYDQIVRARQKKRDDDKLKEEIHSLHKEMAELRAQLKELLEWRKN